MYVKACEMEEGTVCHFPFPIIVKAEVNFCCIKSNLGEVIIVITERIHRYDQEIDHRLES